MPPKLELLDPVSDLLTGPNLTQITTGVETLATKGTAREGVAADGVAKLVVRYPVPSAGVVEFSLVDENGNPLANRPENGTLSDLSGAQHGGMVRVTTVSTSEGEMAFAVYTAPSAFVRAGPTAEQDKQACERGAPLVHVKPVFIPTGGSMVEGEKALIKVKRPLVFLVHGVWSCDQTWENFTPLTNNSAFPPVRADYSTPSADGGQCRASRGFAENASSVYSQLTDAIEKYKNTTGVAVVQAEVVAHSMGGLVTRMMASRSDFLTDPIYPSFEKGPVRHLITIGSPHTGTPMANLALENACLTGFFDDVLGSPTGNGAIRDLAEGSLALQQLNTVANRTPFPIHTIVGVANPSQVAFLNTGNFLLAVVACGDVLQKKIKSVGDVLGNKHDLLVPKCSQKGILNCPKKLPKEDPDGLTDTSFFGVTHSPPFPNPRELNDARIINWTLELLNASNPALFKPLP